MAGRRKVEKSPGALKVPDASIWVGGDGHIRIKIAGRIVSTVPPRRSWRRQAHLWRGLREVLRAEGLWLDSLPNFEVPEG